MARVHRFERMNRRRALKDDLVCKSIGVLPLRIVHFSDWHGKFSRLPEADLYVCTGDMLPNFPIRERDYGLRLFRFNRAHEEAMQTEWMRQPEHQIKALLGSPGSPVICVRGNHDFVPIAGLFVGCDVTELVGNELHEIAGLRVTGHRGIPWIYGTWNDEVHRPDLIERMKAMPEADLYVTHYPPWGILDFDGMPGHGEEHYGLEEMAYQLIKRSTPVDQSSTSGSDDPIAARHLFGHIHECGGQTRQEGNVLFSNAATTRNVIDL